MVLQKLKNKNKKFIKFIDAKGSLKQLLSFQIMPIQRIPRYEMLLKEIVKNTADNHPDRPHLERALQEITKVATAINDSMKEKERQQQLMELQKQVGGSIQLVKPARHFIRSGDLWKKCRSRGGKKLFTFLLFNDAMVYAESSGTSNGRKYNRLHYWISTMALPSRVEQMQQTDTRSTSIARGRKRTKRSRCLRRPRRTKRDGC